MRLFHDTPLATAGGSAYEYDPAIARALTTKSPYDDQGPIENYRRSRGLIWVPRQTAPMGETDRRSWGEGYSAPKFTFVPRDDEQRRVVDESVELLRQHQSFILEAFTGFGKTILGSAISALLGINTLILCTKEDIKTQWLEAIEMVMGIPRSKVGIIQGDKLRNVRTCPIAIAMVQSLSKIGRYPDWVYAQHGLLLADEVQVMGADKFSNVCWQHRGALRLGLTATADRRDGRQSVFEQHIGTVKVKATQLQLIPKVLVYHTGWGPPDSMPVNPGRMGGVTSLMARVDRRNNLIADKIYRVFNHKSGRHSVVFADTLDHLQALRAKVRSLGVPAKDIGFYVGGMSEEDRKINAARRVVFATYKMCSIATNVPRWDTCFFATPRSDVRQITGRILREHDDKSEPVVYDFVDSHPIFEAFAEKRRGWFLSKGAAIKQMGVKKIAA